METQAKAKEQALLEALKTNLPDDEVRYVTMQALPQHVELLRLSKSLVKFAESKFVAAERDTDATELDLSPTAPASALLSAKFSRLSKYFDGRTVGDVARVPEDDLLNRATPHDRLFMRIFIADNQERLVRLAAQLRLSSAYLRHWWLNTCSCWHVSSCASIVV